MEELSKQQELLSKSSSNQKYVNHSISLHSVIIFLLSTIATAFLIDTVPVDNFSYWNWWRRSRITETQENTFPTYAIYGKSKNEDHLKHVVNVLERLGYKRVGLEDKWNLLWAHDYPFLKMPERMKKLRKHQVVNHLPGCGFLTNKVDLSTTRLPFLPRAFRLPSQRDEFLEYSLQNPTVLFVEKHNEHRYIQIRSPAEINLNSNDSFVQEFIQNPLLVDGHKFDIGVYVVITSVNPLRIYMYAGDVLFRYCPVKYHPFNASDVDKYVVGDDYLPTWVVPSLKKYYNRFGGNMRGAFDAYVRDQQKNPATIWTQVEDIVRRTVLAKEDDIIRIMRSYKTRNFFDLMRFDLIVDDKMKVHLMEANMSPNLSSAHFKPNSLLYEQILYSVFNLVGVGSPVKKESPLTERSEDITEMITSEQNLATNLNECANLDCDRSCDLTECDLCIPCLSGSEYEVLEKTHTEHLHRGNMNRIFPKPIQYPDTFDIKIEVQNMTNRNAWITRWFYYKCIYHNTWCH